MKKKTVSTIIICVLIISAFSFIYNWISNKSDKQNKYNLILISVDTLRADHMGIYGYPKNTTPNIDNWAKEAKVFTNAYTIFPSTPQSFYTLFFGRNDILINEMLALTSDKSSVPSLPKFFKLSGFKTAAFITNATLGQFLPLWQKGFDHFKPYFRTDGDPDRESYSMNLANSFKLTDESIDWINKNKNGKFFLWLHYSTPHTPYFSSMKYICQIDSDCSNEKYKQLLSSQVEYNLCPSEKTDKETVEKAKNLYDAAILSVDEQIGRLITELKKQNLYNKSVIVFYGDHGESFEHNAYEHAELLYQSTLHIPFIINIPATTNKNVATLIDNTDILPTILDIFKIQYDKKIFAGNSFISTINELSDTSRIFKKSYVYSLTSNIKSNKLSIFDGEYRYIYSNNDSCLYKGYKEELYNIKKDPEESINLVNLDKDKTKMYKNNLFKFLTESGFNKNDNATNNSDDVNKTIKNLKKLGY